MNSQRKYEKRRIGSSLLILLLVFAFFIAIFPGIITTTQAAPGGWTLVNDARAVKGCPELREYVWQKTPNMLPNGPYDKIGLHRLVKPGATNKGAVFIDPGIYGSGEQLISNPPESIYTLDESGSQAIYWANRGFEVYSIDWRAHFLPLTGINVSQASAALENCGYDQMISDMKEAVDKAKEVSGNPKIFLAGISFGGQVAMYYASEYWKQDLKGIILLDGGENPVKFANVTNTFNLTATLSALARTGQSLAFEYPKSSPTAVYPSGMLFAYQNAVQNPGAPAEWPLGTPLQPTVNPLTNKTWANITEYAAYSVYSTNYSNIYAGYGNITRIIQWRARCDRYIAVRPNVEVSAIRDWNSCPYVSFDFDDHYKEIDVPFLGFSSTLFQIPTVGNYTNGMATTDFTQITLPNYGHMDVFIGTYSAKDVSEPTYQWMLSHLSTLDVTAFSSVRVLPGWTWWFFAQNLGGSAPYSYQWYEGLNPIQGQTSMVMPATKTAPGVYSFYCRVTDKGGTTTTSNAVTLTVIG